MYNFTDSSDNNHMVEFSVTLKIRQKLQTQLSFNPYISFPATEDVCRKKAIFSHCFQNDIRTISVNCFPRFYISKKSFYG